MHTDEDGLPVTQAFGRSSPLIERVMNDVLNELARAVEKHAPMHSAHEAYAVILEELDEFWAEVKKRRENRDADAMRLELIQVAAMACRAAIDLHL